MEKTLLDKVFKKVTQKKAIKKFSTISIKTTPMRRFSEDFVKSLLKERQIHEI